MNSPRRLSIRHVDSRLSTAALAAVLGAGIVAAAASPAGARTLDRVTAAQTVTVSIRLPLRNAPELDRLIASQSDSKSPMYHHFLSPAQFRANFGPSPAALTRIALGLRARGFVVDHVTSQGLVLRATAGTIERTFATRLAAFPDRRAGMQPQIRAVGGITLTPDLAAAGAVVSTFSTRFQHHTDSFRSAVPLAQPLNFLGPYGPYFTDDLKQAYGFPSAKTLDGTGRNIGIVISSFVAQTDVQQFFTDQGIVATPKIVDRKVDGGQPLSPADPNNPGVFEGTLDVEQSLGMAPGATATVYDIPDLSDQSVSDAYQAVVDDNIVDVVNSSFGLCELFYTAPYNIDPTTGKGVDFTSILKAEHAIFKQGNAEGITFVASSGDNGAKECVDAATFSKFILGVSSPAADPNVTGVGGTNLQTTAKPASSRRPNESKYVSENADGDPLIPYDAFGVTDANGNPILESGGIWGSGGGTSVIFQKPYYQTAVAANSLGRSVPDVSGHMGGCPLGITAGTCPKTRSADLETLQGGLYGVIGTSASSPDFAGLLALLGQAYGTRFGNANPLLYGESYLQSQGALPETAFRTGIPGFNGLRTNTLPYDKVLGLGTVYGAGVGQLPGPLAGDPGSPSNP